MSDRSPVQCPVCKRYRLVQVRSPYYQRKYGSGEIRCFKCAHKTRRKNSSLSQRQPDDNETQSKRPLPPAPTIADPGSDDKLQIMIARYHAGFHIHHPRDRSYNNTTKSRAMTEALTSEDREMWRKLMNGHVKLVPDSDLESDLD